MLVSRATLEFISNENIELCVLKGLAVVDDGDHVLDVALRKLAVFQVLLLVSDGFVPVPETHGTVLKHCRENRNHSLLRFSTDLTRKEVICFRQSIRTCSLNISLI